MLVFFSPHLLRIAEGKGFTIGQMFQNLCLERIKRILLVKKSLEVSKGMLNAKKTLELSKGMLPVKKPVEEIKGMLHLKHH